MDNKGKRRNVIFLILFLTAIAPFIWQGFFGHRENQVEFVVPDGFHGIFSIEEDRAKGTPPEYVVDLVRYVIPQSGTLLSTDTSTLFRWHTPHAKYANGKPVPQSTGASNDRHILIGLTSDDKGRCTWLIGTQAEANQYWKDFRIWFRVEPITGE